jgi:hypothetical protein
MAKRRKPTLADHVETMERRQAPRAQARVTRQGTWWNLWLGLGVFFVVLLAAGFFFLRDRGLV